ncbi:hypothetical protein LWI29_008445 [Acer saccharum]|uniref:Germin-like protein n=1 Tax=Acer saccharum TaxID=4024 RepID=A0AA39VQA6_ACESA|nr:hypothetical protein LWI29_008445 [Acer saccharum]
MNRVDFAPGGLNPPHSHPRATESGVVIKGKLLVGFISTNNVYYSKVLTAGQMFVIPKGLVHFQLNVGEGKALTFTAFNSHLPGAAVLPLNLFASTPAIPNGVLTKAFQDFCVANLNSSISFNGFPCKPDAEVTSHDFFFDGFSEEGNTTNVFGYKVTPANVLTFPGLNTLGISMNRVDFAPGGLSTPHSHPRATECGVVIEGKLLVGFITTNNVYYSKVLIAGQMFVIPKGLVHFQLNVGEGKAQTFTAFNSHLPGRQDVPLTLFASTPAIPNEVLTKTFQVEDDVINAIKSKFGFVKY